MDTLAAQPILETDQTWRCVVCTFHTEN